MRNPAPASRPPQSGSGVPPLARCDTVTQYAVRNTRYSPAFTLIEVLAALAIIAILAGLMFYGASSVMNASKRNATRVTLQNGTGMLTEWQKAMNNPASLSLLPVALPIDAAGLKVREDDPGRTGAIIQGTRDVLERFMQAPSAAKMFKQFPQDQLFTVVPAKSPTLLDAWHNPILFVPAGGLNNVNISGQAGCTVTSMSVIPAGVKLWAASTGYSAGDYVYYANDSTLYQATRNIAATDPAPAATASWTPMPAKPFFASAGPDGDFSTGDDNLYSFEN